MFTRRRFLSLAGTTAVAPWLSLPAHAEEPLKEDGSKVIIVGGGLSGLSAALELASKGVAVEVIEAEDSLGGRAASRMENDEQGRLSISQAPFLLAAQSPHVRDFLERLGLSKSLAPASRGWSFLLDDRIIEPRLFVGRLQLMRSIWKRARALGDRFVPRALRKGRKWNRSLQFSEAYASIGGQSVEVWHAAGAPLTPWKALRGIFAPAVFGAELSEIDAASYALAEQFYAGASDEPAASQRLIGNAQIHLWGPVQSALEEMGVQFRLGVEVTDLLLSGGRVSGLTLGGFGEGVWIEDVPEGWTEIERESGPPIRLHRDVSGDLSAFAGDSETPLYVVEASDGIHVEGEDLRSHLEADSVILACGAESAWALAGDLLGLSGPPMIRERVHAQFWFDSALEEDAPTWVLPEPGKLASACVLSSVEIEAREWAEGGGCVIGAQASRAGEDEVAQTNELLQEIREIWPELAEAEPVARVVTHWSFPVPEPGWRQMGATSDAGLPGLVSAGEHVLQSVNVHGFEAAARSGRVAANHALEALDLEASILF